MLWPGKPTVPTAAGTTTNRNDTFAQGTFAWGDSLTAYTPHAGLAQVPVNTLLQRAASNFWCMEFTTDAVGVACFGRRVPQWCPMLSPTLVDIAGGDPASRVAWIRIHVLAGLDAVAGVADANGVGIIPDDGLAFATATWDVRASGGFGIFKRVGTSLFRYVSYSSAPALLESIDLPSANGWHVADFIIRQARRNDATTPWLTFQWDGVAQFTQRAFGHALLPAPSAIRALAHSWAFYMGNIVSSGALSMSWQFRCGGRMPDGTPVLD